MHANNNAGHLEELRFNIWTMRVVTGLGIGYDFAAE